MNLELDDESVHLIDQAADVFSKVAPVSRFRTEQSVWSAVVAAGWGGLGDAYAAGEIDLSVLVGLAREAGRQLLTEQFVTSGFVVPALLHGAIGAGHAELTKRLEHRAAALLGDGRAPEFSLSRVDEGLCFGVEDNEVQPVRLVAGESTELALEFMVDGTVERERVSGLSFTVGEIRVRDATWEAIPLSLTVSELPALRSAERLVHAAGILGTSEAMLVQVRDYTLERVQFGVPIASFQAVKHGLADVLAANEVAWAAVLCACADGLQAEIRHGVARALCHSAAELSASSAAQFFGGIGFTWESDLHLYLKAALDGRMRYGSRDEGYLDITNRFLEEAC